MSSVAHEGVTDHSTMHLSILAYCDMPWYVMVHKEDVIRYGGWFHGKIIAAIGLSAAAWELASLA